MSLCDMYYSVDVYREVANEDAWGNQSKQDNWTLDHTEMGFIQPRGGSYGQANNKLTELSTHVIYCGVDVDIVTGDRIYYSGLKLDVLFVQPSYGIGGIGDHQEISLSVAGSA